MLNTPGSLAYVLGRGQRQRFTGFETIGGGSMPKRPKRGQVQQGDNRVERPTGPGQQYG